MLVIGERCGKCECGEKFKVIFSDYDVLAIMGIRVPVDPQNSCKFVITRKLKPTMVSTHTQRHEPKEHAWYFQHTVC